jgi:hypothetical protein
VDPRAPSADCQYVLYTRFNVPIPDYRKRLEDRGIVYEDWLAEKKRAFFRYCLPSVTSQSHGDFLWIIAFGEKTAEVEEILDSISPHAFVRPVFLEAGGPELRRSILETYRALPPRRLLATVRLDCDDALNLHFFHNLDRYVSSVVEADAVPSGDWPLSVSFPYGAKIFGDRWCPANWPANPFVCLVEETSSKMKTVFARPHGEIRSISTIKELGTLQPMWGQMLGTTNIMNELGAREAPIGPVTPELLSLFGLEAERRRGISGWLDRLIGTPGGATRQTGA